MQDGPILVLCTAPSEEAGASLARGLVEAKLAACVNILSGVRSVYTWKDEVHDEPEVQLLIKTRSQRFSALEAWIREHHPYEVPEIIALPIEQGSRPYLEWLRAQTSEQAP